MRIVLIIAVALVALIGIGAAITARTHTPPFRTPDGGVAAGSIAEERRMTLGGVEQYVLIRGRDRTAPLLVFLHGGPGSPEMPLLRVYNAALEDDFVVVNWDQRGAGKSYRSDLDPATLTLDRITADLDELIDQLRAEFGHDQVLLVGHSWGTILGLEYVSRHPEKVAAYVGVGQVSASTESEASGLAWAIEQARAHGDEKAVGVLEALTPPPYSLDEVVRQRRYVWKYGGAAHDHESFADYLFIGARASEASWPDMIAMLRGSDMSLKALWDTVQSVDANTDYPRLDVPVFFFLGRHDRVVSSKLAAEYFERLQAPSKELVWFENSAHLVPFEEPDRFNTEIVRVAREAGLLE